MSAVTLEVLCQYIGQIGIVARGASIPGGAAAVRARARAERRCCAGAERGGQAARVNEGSQSKVVVGVLPPLAQAPGRGPDSCDSGGRLRKAGLLFFPLPLRRSSAGYLNNHESNY